MHVAVDRRAAGVHAHERRLERRERLHAAGQRVVQPHRMHLDLPPAGTPPIRPIRSYFNAPISTPPTVASLATACSGQAVPAPRVLSCGWLARTRTAP